MKRAAVMTPFLWWLLAATASHADEGARKYAALSLIGETMSVVAYVGDTGAQLSQNRHESVSLGSQLFDTTALGAVQQSLKARDPRKPVALFLGTSPTLFAEQAKLFDGQRVVLPQDLGAAMKKAGATHLFLITRHRGATAIQGYNGTFGSGTLEGLGYYIDNDLRTWVHREGGTARGFLAPFVYLRISLVDLETSMIEREQFITWSVMLSAVKSESGNPRDVLAGKRLQYLLDALAREVSRAVPALTR
jgi:hypothetical protein